MEQTYRDLLETSRADSLKILHQVTDMQLNGKLNAKTWSIGQVLEHLAKIEKGIAYRLAEGLKNSMSFEEKALPLHRVVARDVKVSAPSFVEPGEGPYTKDQLEALLADSRQTFAAVLATAGDGQSLHLKTSVQKHPIFGEMSLYQWAELVPFHEQRHQAQMKEILAALS